MLTLNLSAARIVYQAVTRHAGDLQRRASRETSVPLAGLLNDKQEVGSRLAKKLREAIDVMESTPLTGDPKDARDPDVDLWISHSEFSTIASACGEYEIAQARYLERKRKKPLKAWEVERLKRDIKVAQDTAIEARRLKGVMESCVTVTFHPDLHDH